MTGNIYAMINKPWEIRKILQQSKIDGEEHVKYFRDLLEEDKHDEK